MTGKAANILPGNTEAAPDPGKGRDGDLDSQDPSREAAPAFDAIAYAARTDSIKKLIEEFGGRHLTREYITFAFNLCDKISITPELDILRGQKNIWAASIAHVIARLNFLFDSSGEHVLTPALICAHFKTNKSTVSNRASQIQKICAIKPGTKGYCRQDIVDAVTYHETADSPGLPSGRPGKPGAEKEKRSPRTDAPLASDEKQLKLFE